MIGLSLFIGSALVVSSLASKPDSSNRTVSADDKKTEIKPSIRVDSVLNVSADCFVAANFVKAIENPKDVKEIWFSHNSLSECDLSPFTNLAKLTLFKVSGLDQSLIDQLASMESIKNVEIRETKLSASYSYNKADLLFDLSYYNVAKTQPNIDCNLDLSGLFKKDLTLHKNFY